MAAPPVEFKITFVFYNPKEDEGGSRLYLTKSQTTPLPVGLNLRNVG